MDIVDLSIFATLHILFATGTSLMDATAELSMKEEAWEKEWNKRFHPSVDLSEEQSSCNLEEGH